MKHLHAVLHFGKGKRLLTSKLFLIFFVLTSMACKKEQYSSEKDVLSFLVVGQDDTSNIDAVNAQVTLNVPSTLDISNISPQISVSKGASIKPTSGTSVDFSGGDVNYVVTAEDKSTKDWLVKISTVKSNAAEIESFYLSRQKSDAVIADGTVTIAVKLGTDVTNLKPEISISPGAVISPATGESVDFSSGMVEYTVTAENGVTKIWQVTLEQETIYEANILTYTIPQQIGENVVEGSKIEIQVPVGTDISALIPEITITEGATVEPKSGVAVDFTQLGYVDYIVTTEVGSKKTWRVSVIEEIKMANNEYFNYVGRWSVTNPLKPRAYAPGAYVNIKFKGTYCQILLNDEVKYGSNHNYLEIIIDGTDFHRIQTTDKTNTIDLVSGLSDAEHTVTICKNTESNIGYIEFIGVRCEELLPFDDITTHKIECIGNSITCGTGSDESEVACGEGDWHDQHNAYFSYGPETARKFNAQWHLSSVSGIGVIHSCCDMTYEISDVFDRINLYPGGEVWDFTKYTPELVTICLGQNDGIQDSVTYCSAYVDLIHTIRNKYTDANIICLTSPMADAILVASQKSYLTGIVDRLNTNGDTKVYKYYFSKSFNSGCDTHPDLNEHKQIADELATFITTTFGW